MTHRLPGGHRAAPSRMWAFKLGATLLTGLLGSTAWAQDLAYPRYSPLQIRDSGDSDVVRSLSLPFGVAFRVIDRHDGVAVVSLQDGTKAQVRLSDLFIPPTPTHVRPGATFATQDRARLSFWDSPLRAEGFLRDGPSAQTRPILQEIGAGGVPALLPVSEMIEVPIRAGRSVLLVGGLVAMPGETLALLDDGDAAAARPVTLHVIVDGSEYTREFSQRQLQDLSRMMEAQATDAASLPQVSRTVLFNSGEVTTPEITLPSGLRRILPEVGISAGGDLSSALVAALKRLQRDIAAESSHDRAHVVLMLLGPGLRADLVEDPAFLTLAQALREVPGDVGLLLGAVTPEPSDIPARVLSRLGNGMPSGLVVFGANLGSEVANMVREVTRTRSAPNIAALCGFAQDQGVPCLSAPDAETLRRLVPVAPDAALDWFAIPLWYVVDGNILVIENREPVAGPGVAGDGAADRAEVQARTDALRTDLARTQQAAAAAEAQVAALRDAQARAEQDRALAAAAAEAGRVETDRMTAALAELEGRAARLDGALAEATRTGEALTGSLAARDADLQTARSALAAAETEAETLRAEVFAATGRAAALTRSIDDAEARATVLDAVLADAEAAGLVQADRIAALERAVADADAGRAQVETELSQALVQAAGLDAELAATTTELRLIAEDRARRIAQLAALQADYDADRAALGAEIARASDALAQAQAELATRDGRIAALDARIAEGDADRARTVRALDKTRQIVAQLEAGLAQGDAELAAVSADLYQSRAELGALADRMAEAVAALASAEADLAATEVALDLADQARRAVEESLAASVAEVARLADARDADVAALAVAADALAARDADLASLRLRIDEQADLVTVAVAERDQLRQMSDAQAAELAEARRMLESLWADAEAAAAGQTDAAVLRARLEQGAKAVLSAESRIGELNAAKQDLRTRLAATEARAADMAATHQAELDGLRTSHTSELDALRTALAADMAVEQQAHADTRAAADGTEQAISRVLVDLAAVLGADLAHAEPGQSDLDLLADLVAEAGELMPRATTMVRTAEAELAEAQRVIADSDAEGESLRTRLAGLEAEKAYLMERMQVAVGVADENMQLVAIVKEAERMILAQDESHLAEVEALRQQLAAALANGAPVGKAPAAPTDPSARVASAVRPQPRPADLQVAQDQPATPRPAAQPAVAPRAAAPQPAAVRTGAGFFGN